MRQFNVLKRANLCFLLPTPPWPPPRPLTLHATALSPSPHLRHRLRYHQLHPEYIHTRIERVGQSYSLRVLLIHCDADNHAPAMRELNKVALVMGYTMIVAWK